MAKFILLYKGPATPMEDMTAEQSEQSMQAWTSWMGKVGSAIVDVGNPFAARAGVAGDGSTTSASDLNGYSIVEAADLQEAKGFCDSHPFLSDGTSRFVIEVYELAPVPM
jgi:hypothetical protein